MKLRVRKNSLRLRLNSQDVAALTQALLLEDQVNFPGNSALIYRLVPTADSRLDAAFSNGIITVSIPLAKIRDWAPGEEIGLYFKIENLDIAIEKDLECTTASTEESDPYAYPRKAAC